MERLSERWMYYSELLSATLSAKVDDLKHIQNLIDAEEHGLLLRLPIGKDRSDLIYILARLLMHTEFGNCYLCTNPMKNVTLDGKNNGCDGNCRFDEKFDEDDLITKIIKELRTKEEAEQALAKMKEV